jgi:hypothetical protein
MMVKPKDQGCQQSRQRQPHPAEQEREHIANPDASMRTSKDGPDHPIGGFKRGRRVEHLAQTFFLMRRSKHTRSLQGAAGLEDTLLWHLSLLQLVHSFDVVEEGNGHNQVENLLEVRSNV